MPKKLHDFSWLTQVEIAEAFGVTARSIRDWEANEGFPRNKDGHYTLSHCIQWAIARRSSEGLDLETEKARLAKEQADKYALENAARRGQLLELSYIERTWGYLFSGIREKTLGLPTKVAAELAEISDANAIRERLTNEVYQILADAAAYRPADAGAYVRAASDEDERNIETAAKVNGEPVGGQGKKAKPRKQRGARTVAH